MDVRLLRPWRGRPAGTILSGLPSGMAMTMIERRFAEAVEATAPRRNEKRERSRPAVRPVAHR